MLIFLKFAVLPIIRVYMKKTSLIFISSIVLFSLINISLAQAGYVWVKVQYSDSCPRSGADVIGYGDIPFGTTNESGLTDSTLPYWTQPKMDYDIKAWYPTQVQFGEETVFETDQYGNGNATIINNSILDSDGNGIGDCHQPQWRNQGQNQSSFLKGNTNLLYAQAKSYKLDWAWLATNETGVWQNKTYMDMNDATEWTWSNFTWTNSSFTGNLSWKIYYNDTSGFTSMTNEMTFEVLAPTCGLSANPIDFGSLKTGQISTEDKTVTLNNNGNSPTTSLTMIGTKWTYLTYEMPIGQTHWNLLSGQNYDSMTPLTNPGESLGEQASPSNPLPVYFKLKIPEGQSMGTYIQTITFTGSC